MSLIRTEGVQYKPWITKIKVERLVSEDDNYFYCDVRMDYCCSHHRKFPKVMKAVAYPKYAWLIQ